MKEKTVKYTRLTLEMTENINEKMHRISLIKRLSSIEKLIKKDLNIETDNEWIKAWGMKTPLRGTRMHPNGLKRKLGVMTSTNMF